MERISNISRETKETRIQAALWLSGGPVKMTRGSVFLTTCCTPGLSMQASG